MIAMDRIEKSLKRVCKGLDANDSMPKLLKWRDKHCILPLLEIGDNLFRHRATLTMGDGILVLKRFFAIAHELHGVWEDITLQRRRLALHIVICPTTDIPLHAYALATSTMSVDRVHPKTTTFYQSLLSNVLKFDLVTEPDLTSLSILCNSTSIILAPAEDITGARAAFAAIAVGEAYLRDEPSGRHQLTSRLLITNINNLVDYVNKHPQAC